MDDQQKQQASALIRQAIAQDVEKSCSVEQDQARLVKLEIDGWRSSEDGLIEATVCAWWDRDDIEDVLPDPREYEVSVDVVTGEVALDCFAS